MMLRFVPFVLFVLFRNHRDAKNWKKGGTVGQNAKPFGVIYLPVPKLVPSVPTWDKETCNRYTTAKPDSFQLGLLGLGTWDLVPAKQRSDVVNN